MVKRCKKCLKRPEKAFLAKYTYYMKQRKRSGKKNNGKIQKLSFSLANGQISRVLARLDRWRYSQLTLAVITVAKLAGYLRKCI